MKKKIKLYIFLISCCFLLLSCSGNLLSTFGDNTSDDALLFSASEALDKSDYSAALTFISSMTTTGQATSEALELEASAFAGRCGFQFLSFVEALGSSGGGSFLTILMNAMPNGTTAKRDDCLAAVNVLKEISTDAALRTNDQNILMALVSLALMGVILNTDADTDNDAVLDLAYDHCAVGSSADANVNIMVSSMANASASLGAIGSSSIAGDGITGLTDACADLAAGGFDFCSVIDPDLVGATERKGMRGVIGTTGGASIGVGTSNTPAACNTGDALTCAGVCP